MSFALGRRLQTDGSVVDVVVRGDHAEVERGGVHVVGDGDALGRLQLPQRRLHQVRQVVRQVPVRDALQNRSVPINTSK